MSCHLHELIEAVDAKDYYLASHFGASPAEGNFVIVEREMKVAREAMCFDLGPIAGFANRMMIPELVKLPYETCWFELQGQDGPSPVTIGVLAYKGGREWAVWSRHSNIWVFQYFAKAEFGVNEILFTMSADVDNTTHRKSFALAMELVFAFLSALNCCNVTRVENLPPPKLQKARAKRGKKPLFSYWTLHLALDRTESSPGNGTHASPRLHLVRGHARRLHFQPGKFTWVRAYAKGDKKLGMVHKEYALDQPQLAC